MPRSRWTPGTGARHAAEILVLDPAVEDADDPPRGVAEVLRLAPGGRGLEQIAGYLAGRREVAGLHIHCRGEPGALLLVGERIDLPALAVRAGLLLDVAAALARDATVALCAGWVAAGPQGRRFVDYFESAMGVAVAASVGPVGAQARDGWRPGPIMDRVVRPSVSIPDLRGVAGRDWSG